MPKWIIALVSLLIGAALGVIGTTYLGVSTMQPEPMPLPAPDKVTETPQPAVEDPYGPDAKADLIFVDSHEPGDLVELPLVITGKARGTWYFEASFPVKVFDADGQQVGIGIAQAQGDWMTENFVPFSVEIDFPLPSTPTGTVVFERDNASGLPEHDNHMTFPVTFYE